jgi:hypothetical protein
VPRGARLERRRLLTEVGALLLLLGDEDHGVEIGPGLAQKLAGLGVTDVSVLRDERTTAVALNGWALDVDGSADAVVRLLAADPAAARVLRPVIESAVHRGPATFGGETT